MMASMASAADIPESDVVTPAAQALDELYFAGIAELYGGYASLTNRAGNATGDIDDTGYGLIGGAGRVSVPFLNMFSVQLDVEGENNFLDNATSGQYAGSILGAGHVSYRDPNMFLIGLFGGLGEVYIDGDDDADMAFAGVEGQYYWNDLTLYLQGGWLDGDDPDNSDVFHDAWFIRGEGRYFWGDNTMFSAQLAYANGEQDSGSGYDMDVWGWGVRAEHQFDQFHQFPVGVFAAYEGGHYDNGCCGPGDRGRYTEHVFLAGGKFVFGPPSLKQNDRGGATLNLPRFGRWIGSGNAID